MIGSRLGVFVLIAICLPLHPAGADVISYLRFEENGGATAFDETGLLNGELVQFVDTSPGGGDTVGEGWSANVPSSTIPLTGEANTGSIRFGGGSEFIDVSNGLDLSLGTSFTIEFYMNPDAVVIGSSVFGFGPDSDLYFSLTDSLGVLYFNMEFMDQMPYTLAQGVQTGVWQHVALVKQPGQYSIYLNGQLIADDSLPSSADGPYFFTGTDVTGDRTIGGESGTWRGYLDEFRISDEALTPDQFLIVPEPSTLMLLALGCVGMYCRRRQTRN